MQSKDPKKESPSNKAPRVVILSEFVEGARERMGSFFFFIGEKYKESMLAECARDTCSEFCYGCFEKFYI